jgi:hypothetical protein
MICQMKVNFLATNEKAWPGLVRLIAKAAQESSLTLEQHAQFCEIMEKQQVDLTSLLDNGEV